jgi:hypothetical protein
MPTVLKELARRTLRPRNPPFAPSPQPPPLLVHCCHHKVGTLWLTRVLGAVAATHGLRFLAGDQGALTADVDIFLQDHSRVDPAGLGRFRGSHMIRDPRDVVVSAYFYHLRTDEAWCHRPSPEYGGLGYQAYLRSLPRTEGLMVEIERCASTVIRDMVAWSPTVEGFHEMRYETLLEDENEGFRRLFTHYGFTAEATERCVGLAERFSLKRLRRRSVHIRAGHPGQWRAHFTPAHARAFKRLTDDAAFALGYESTSSW